MRIKEHLTIFACGVISAAAFHVSCGDGDPVSADGMNACDCPPSEPPLSARLVRVTARKDGAPASRIGVAAACALGDTVVSGGCQSRSTDPSVVLRSSFAAAPEAPDAWFCDFYNGTASPVTFEAYVLCLKPAP